MLSQQQFAEMVSCLFSKYRDAFSEMIDDKLERLSINERMSNDFRINQFLVDNGVISFGLPFNIKQIISKKDGLFEVKTMITTDSHNYSEGGVMVCFKQQMAKLEGFDLFMTNLVDYYPEPKDKETFMVFVNKDTELLTLRLPGPIYFGHQDISCSSFDKLFGCEQCSSMFTQAQFNKFLASRIEHYFDRLGARTVELNSKLHLDGFTNSDNANFCKD